MRPKKELIRIVRTPAGDVDLDPTGKKSGRGAYVCPSAECIGIAIKTKRLEKALECQLGEELIGKIRARLEIRD
jgi:hypothetical protein